MIILLVSNSSNVLVLLFKNNNNNVFLHLQNQLILHWNVFGFFSRLGQKSRWFCLRFGWVLKVRTSCKWDSLWHHRRSSRSPPRCSARPFWSVDWRDRSEVLIVLQVHRNIFCLGSVKRWLLTPGCIQFWSKWIAVAVVFNTVSHKLLPQRLRVDFGGSGLVLKGFVSYLTNRTFSIFWSNLIPCCFSGVSLILTISVFIAHQPSWEYHQAFYECVSSLL